MARQPCPRAPRDGQDAPGRGLGTRSDPAELLGSVLHRGAAGGDAGQGARGGTLDKQLTQLARPKLLIIDELGYLPFEANAAHLFFQLVAGLIASRKATSRKIETEAT